MAAHGAPKHRCLDKNTSVTAFEKWRHALCYLLALFRNSTYFLAPGASCHKKTKVIVLRGFTNDGEAVAEALRLWESAVEKSATLHLMLGQIANFCPVISRNTIVKNSVSLNDIWQAIRMHFDFHTAGAHISDFTCIRPGIDERPEDLYQRIVAFVEDNMATAGSSITRHGVAPTDDEELSQTMENMIVLWWLHLVDVKLPKLVKQRYGTELRSCTLASIKPEVSTALDSLREELHSIEEIKVARASSMQPRRSASTAMQPRRSTFKDVPSTRRDRHIVKRVGPFCKQAGRPSFDHYRSRCPHLPDVDRAFLTRARVLTCRDHEEIEDCQEQPQVGENVPSQPARCKRVEVRNSPHIDMFCCGQPVSACFDTGSESNMIRTSVVKKIRGNIASCPQIALQADGVSVLPVAGEAQITLSLGSQSFPFRALVVDALDSEVLIGIPFMIDNDVRLHPAKRVVSFGHGKPFLYQSRRQYDASTNMSSVSYVARNDSKAKVIWPGGSLKVDLPLSLCNEDAVVLEPRMKYPLHSDDRRPWIPGSHGTIRASPHRISTLSSCPPPTTVFGLKSFLGAYRVLSRVIPNCASVLSSLQHATDGRKSQEPISWSDQLLTTFSEAQKVLTTNKAITLPKPEDKLWIVTDGSVSHPGIGATLYITRSGSTHLAGFFSMKLKKRMFTWIPCEIEALAIASAIKHFGPYIIQSSATVTMLTDSKPCVQVFSKLCRGEYSASPRLTTFLSTVSHYQATVEHLAGSKNLPTDFASRNAPDCLDSHCQVCTFVQNIMDSPVAREVSSLDIISAFAKMPFTNRTTWRSLQMECPDLRRVYAHLTRGTRPSKKLTGIRDVKRYLAHASISRDGLLVARKPKPFDEEHERIIIPRTVLDGFLTAMHIRLNHPTLHQFRMLCRRYFFALDFDQVLDQTSQACHQCQALKRFAACPVPQSTGDPPASVGYGLAADVMRQDGQFILVVREVVTSFTSAQFVENEKGSTVRNGLLSSCAPLVPLDGPNAVVRTDPAPGFVALKNDDILESHRLSLEIGQAKNVNKNPVAEKAIQELQDEIMRVITITGPVTTTMRCLAVARLNSRIRSRGLSTQRDHYTNAQIPIKDRDLIDQQFHNGTRNHSFSEKTKCPRGTSHSRNIFPGDLVYLYADRKKLKARDRYIVTSVDGCWCSIRKFTENQLRNHSYRVRKSDCFKIPTEVRPLTQPATPGKDEDEESLLPVATPAPTSFPACDFPSCPCGPSPRADTSFSSLS